MRLLTIFAILAFAFPAMAGNNNGPQSNATAVGVGVGVATGGKASAGATSNVDVDNGGENVFLNFGGASTGGASPVWDCAMTEQRNALGIIAWQDSYESGNCMAMKKLALCQAHWKGLSNEEQTACINIRKRFIVGPPIKFEATRAVRLETPNRDDPCPGKDVCDIGEGGYGIYFK